MGENETREWAEIVELHEKLIAKSTSATTDLSVVNEEKNLLTSFLDRISIADLCSRLTESQLDEALNSRVPIILKILDRIFTSSIGSIFLSSPSPQIESFLINGLKNPNDSVRQLTIQLIHLHFKKQKTKNSLMDNESILQTVCDSLEDEVSGISRLATEVLAELCADPNSSIFSKILLILQEKAHNEDLQEDSIVYFRYLALIAEVAGSSDQGFLASKEKGLLQPIINGINNDDDLFRMNIIDIIPLLYKCKTGLIFIYESGILLQLINLSDDVFCGGNSLRLIGELCNSAVVFEMDSWIWADSSLSKKFISQIETKISSSDIGDKVAGMDALAAFAATSEKELYMVLQHQFICESWLLCAVSNQQELKANCFTSIARILSSKSSSKNLGQRKLEFFNKISDVCNGVRGTNISTLDIIYSSLKQPFEPLRISAYVLLKAISLQDEDWGFQLVVQYAGLIDYLVNRTTEVSKEMKDLKFDLIETISKSEHIHLLGENERMKLNNFIMEGPYFAKIQRGDDILLKSR